MYLKTAFASLVFILLSACATDANYALYVETTARIEASMNASRSAEAVAKQNSELVRYAALAEIAKTGDEVSKIAAVMALAFGNGSNSNTARPQERVALQSPPQDKALAWASLLIPTLTQVVGMSYNYRLGTVQSNNARNIAVSTNNAFTGMGNSIASTATAGLNSTQAVAGTGLTAVQNTAMSMGSDMRGLGISLGNNLQGTSTALGDNLQSTSIAFGNNLQSVSTSLGNNIQGTAVSLGNNLQNTSTSLGNNLQSVSNTATTSNAANMATFSSGMSALGSQIQAPAAPAATVVAGATTNNITTTTTTIAGAGVVGSGTLSTTDSHNTITTANSNNQANPVTANPVTDNHTTNPTVVIDGKVCSVNPATGALTCI